MTWIKGTVNVILSDPHSQKGMTDCRFPKKVNCVFSQIIMVKNRSGPHLNVGSHNSPFNIYIFPV